MTLIASASAGAAEPKLEARAITFPAPFPGAPNTDPAPAPGSVQPVGGFSALLDAGDGDFSAMPDNGFGSKTKAARLEPRQPVPARPHPLVRHVYEFDVSERRYTGRNWIYRMSIPGTLVSDAVAYGKDQLMSTTPEEYLPSHWGLGRAP
jgi:hypothetical protein